MGPTDLRLLLVRHGEVPGNISWKLLGDSDESLTTAGELQADEIAAALAPLPIAAVWSSPLERTRQTAGQIASALGLQVQIDDRLRELSFGRWEGLAESEIAALGPADRALLERWRVDPDLSPPAGESWSAMCRRAVAFADELRRSCPESWIVAVSHVGPIKALLGAALGAPFSSNRRLFLDPGTVSVIDWSDPPLVRLFNAPAACPLTTARWVSTQ